MTWWMILLIIFAVLWLISLLRLGGAVKYSPKGLSVAVIAGPVRKQILPAAEKKNAPKAKKEAKPKKEKPAAETPADEDKPGTLSRMMKLLPVVGEAAGALKRKIRMDDLKLSVVWGAENDAAAAAIGYGRANAAIGMIWPVLDHNFKVKKAAFHVDVDYNAASPVVAVEAAVTMTLGQLLSFGIHYGCKLLINWSRSGKPSAK